MDQMPPLPKVTITVKRLKSIGEEREKIDVVELVCQFRDYLRGH